MGDQNSQAALREEAAPALVENRPADALPVFERCASAATGPGLGLECLVGRVACLRQLARVDEARALAGSSPLLQLHPSSVKLVAYLLTAENAEHVDGLRAEVERFSQGIEHWASSTYPPLFACLERWLWREDEETIRTPHDYSVTSYSLWLEGLRGLGQGQYDSAVTHLLQSISRYELGEMQGDVLWSHYDTVVAYLLLNRPEEASRHYEAFLSPAAPNHFARMAALMLRAYEARDRRHVSRVAEEMAEEWGARYKDTWYPQIFDRFEEHLSAASTLGKANGAERSTASSGRPSSATVVTPGATPRIPFLISRPARRSDEEVEELTQIAGQVNLGNTRPDPEKIRQHIEFSLSTLRGALGWDQGMVFLVTEFYPEDGAPPALVGCCKLQYMVDGCWRKRDRYSGAIKQHQSVTAILEFDGSSLNAVEMAGNVIHPSYLGRKWNWFHAQTRFLYVLRHGVGDFHYLVANLLTTDDDGSYPFYEQVVKHLVAESKGDQGKREMSYDSAEDKRYTHKDFFIQLLDRSANNSSVQFPVCVLPPALQQRIGEVRPQTMGAHRVLHGYGFSAKALADGCERFDLLDAGPYIGISVEKLRLRCQNQYLRTYLARVADSLPQGLAWVAFAPQAKSAAEFRAAKCPVLVDGDSLVIPREVANRLDLHDGDPVDVLRSPNEE